jgi:TPR repeat protein
MLLEKDPDFRLNYGSINQFSFLPKVLLILSPADYYSLGLKYRDGNGFKKNLLEAVKYFKMAAD